MVFLHVDGVDLSTCCECVLEDTSVLEVSEFCLYESWTLTWLYMLEPYDLAWLSVVVEIKSVLKISCCCHKNIKCLKILVLKVSRFRQKRQAGQNRLQKYKIVSIQPNFC